MNQFHESSGEHAKSIQNELTLHVYTALIFTNKGINFQKGTNETYNLMVFLDWLFIKPMYNTQNSKIRVTRHCKKHSTIYQDMCSCVFMITCVHIYII